MGLKFYAYKHSTAAMIVSMVLRMKKIPYDYIEVDLGKGEHKKPDYLAIQPFGLVPSIIEDDGFTLFESRAIARYLAEKYPSQGPELIPSSSNLKKRALFEQALNIEAFNFDRHINPLIYEVLLPKMRGLAVDEKRTKQLTDDLAKSLDVYDQILSKQKYLAGDELTLVDLYHLPGANLLPLIDINHIQEKPNVKRWWDEISKLEEWQKIKDGLPGEP